MRQSTDDTIREALTARALVVDPQLGTIAAPSGVVFHRTSPDGYVRVPLDGGRRALAHRVVWLAAHSNIPTGLVVNHVNGTRDDNRLVNLELVTHAENRAHADGGHRYDRVRPSDITELAETDPEWLAALIELSSRPDVTAEDVAALRAQASADSTARVHEGGTRGVLDRRTA